MHQKNIYVFLGNFLILFSRNKQKREIKRRSENIKILILQICNFEIINKFSMLKNKE